MSELNEFFAEEFALALTMPVLQLMRARREGLSVIAIGKRFGVPIDKVHARIESLNRHPHDGWTPWMT